MYTHIHTSTGKLQVNAVEIVTSATCMLRRNHHINIMKATLAKYEILFNIIYTKM